MKKLFIILITGISLGIWAQVPESVPLFDLSDIGDSIEYIKVARVTPNGVVERQITFDIDCKDLKLAVGKTMALDDNGDPIGGIFPESFGELDNPITLDTTAVDTNGDLLFRKHGPIGEIWNFNLKFTDWNSYYLVFVIADMGDCSEGIIELWK